MAQHGPRMTLNDPKLPKNDPKFPKITPKWLKDDARSYALFQQFFLTENGSANFFAFRMYGDMFALAYTSRKSQNFGNKVNL